MAPTTKRTCLRMVAILVLLISPLIRFRCRAGPGLEPAPTTKGQFKALRRDGLVIGRLPAPGAGAVTALDHALLLDLRDDLAVAGEQRLGRAHLRAQRQLALGQPVGAVLFELGLAAVRL